MASILKKIGGIVLLSATIGLASCQALWIEAPGVPLMTEWWN